MFSAARKTYASSQTKQNETGRWSNHELEIDDQDGLIDFWSYVLASTKKVISLKLVSENHNAPSRIYPDHNFMPKRSTEVKFGYSKPVLQVCIRSPGLLLL